MTDQQSNRLDMYHVVHDFYEEEQAVIDVVPARANAFGQLNPLIGAINTEVAGQSSNLSGVTEDKDMFRESLNEYTASVFSTVKAYAQSVANNTLGAEFDFAISEIRKIKDDTMQGFCDHRITLVNDNLVDLADFGIDAATVTEWQTRLDAYVEVLEAPRVALNARVLHTQRLKELFDEAAQLFYTQLDPLMRAVRNTEPELYNKYVQARIIIDRKGGGSSSGTATTVDILGNVSNIDDMTPIQAAIVSFSTADNATPITDTTDSEGKYSLKLEGLAQDATESGTLKVEHPDFEPFEMTIEVSAGNSYDHNFELPPIVQP